MLLLVYTDMCNALLTLSIRVLLTNTYLVSFENVYNIIALNYAFNNGRLAQSVRAWC